MGSSYCDSCFYRLQYEIFQELRKVCWEGTGCRGDPRPVDPRRGRHAGTAGLDDILAHLAGLLLQSFKKMKTHVSRLSPISKSTESVLQIPGLRGLTQEGFCLSRGGRRSAPSPLVPHLWALLTLTGTFVRMVKGKGKKTSHQSLCLLSPETCLCGQPGVHL